MRRLSDFHVTVYNAGALGANTTESLARQGLPKLLVIDRDRIEERNLSTQPYYTADVGTSQSKDTGKLHLSCAGDSGRGESQRADSEEYREIWRLSYVNRNVERVDAPVGSPFR